MKLNSMLLGAALPLAAAAATAQPVEALLDQALAGPQRSVANKARDAARHPKETLLFFGLHPDQTVIEIAPGSGWYTEIVDNIPAAINGRIAPLDGAGLGLKLKPELFKRSDAIVRVSQA